MFEVKVLKVEIKLGLLEQERGITAIRDPDWLSVRPGFNFQPSKLDFL